MSYTLYRTAAFGSAKAGLSTVGYQLFDAAGMASGSRVTTGVQDLGYGQYGAVVTHPDGFAGRITWDTGETPPVPVSEAINPQTGENLDQKISVAGTTNGTAIAAVAAQVTAVQTALTALATAVAGLPAAVWAYLKGLIP